MRTTSFLSPMGGVMLVLLLCAISSVNSYSKYGRGCGDIGCLPNEICVLSHDSCGFGQRDGKECGNYPTCKKSGAASSNSGGVKPSENDDKFNGLILSQDDDDYEGLLLRVARSVPSSSGSEGQAGKNNVADEPQKKRRRKTKSRKAYKKYVDSGSDLSKPKQRKGNPGVHRMAKDLLNKYKRQRINSRVSPVAAIQVDSKPYSNQKSQQIGAEGSSEKLGRVARSVAAKDQEEAMPMSEDANVHLQVQGYGAPPPRYGPRNGQGYWPPPGNGQGPNRQGTGQRPNGMQWQQQRGPGLQSGPYGRGGQGQRPGQGQGQGRWGYSQGPYGRPNQYGRVGGQNQNGRGGNLQNGRMGGGGRGQGQWLGQGRGGMGQGPGGRGGPGGLRQSGSGQDNNQGTSTTTSEPSDPQYQDHAAHDQVTEAAGVQSLRRFNRAIDGHLASVNLEELQMRSLFGQLMGKSNPENISTAAPLASNVRTNTSPLAKQSTPKLTRAARGLLDKFNRKEKKNGAVPSQPNADSATRPQQTGERQGKSQKTGANGRLGTISRVTRSLMDKFKRKYKKSNNEATPAAVGQQANTVPAARPQQTGASHGTAQKAGVNSKPRSLHRVARGLFDKFKRKDKKSNNEANPAAVGQQANTVPAARPQQTSASQGSAQKTGDNVKPGSLHRVASGLFDKFKRKDKKSNAEATPAAVSQQANAAPAASPQKSATKRGSVQSRVVRAIAPENERAGFRPKANSEQVNQQRVNGYGQWSQGQNRQSQAQSRQSPVQNRQGQRQNSQPSARQIQSSRQVSSANGRIGYSQRSSDGRTGVSGSRQVDYQPRSGSQFSAPLEWRPEEWSQESRYRDYDRGYDRYGGYNSYEQRRGPPPDDWYRTYNQYPPSWSGGPPPSSSNTYQNSYTGGPPIYQSQRGGTVPSQQGGYQTEYQTSVYYPNRRSTRNGYRTRVGAGSQAYTQGGPAYGQPMGPPPPTVSSSGYTFVQFPNGTSVHYGVAMEPVASTAVTTTTTTAPTPFALTAPTTTKK